MTLIELIRDHELLARCDMREKSTQWHREAAEALRWAVEAIRATERQPATVTVIHGEKRIKRKKVAK